MINDTPHIINKIKADLALPEHYTSEEGSEKFKVAIREALKNVRKELDRNYSDSYYQIDYLSVELNLKENDLPKLSRLLENAILDSLQKASGSRNAGYSPAGTEIKKTDSDNRMRSLVTFFLQTGQFPWWAANESFQNMEEWMSQLTSDEWLNTITPIKEKNPHVLKRLSAQFPSDLVGRLIQISDYGFSKIEEKEREAEESTVDYKILDLLDDDFSVSNAGLVLLNPFLEHLLNDLGALDEGTFPNEQCQERTVCLLHYLASGCDNFEEQLLILPKFLCGLPLTVPVNRFLRISDYEKEECLSFLRNILKQWELENEISLEALQQNFLQRRGVLKKEITGWSLYVEEKEEDYLLDRLPWHLLSTRFNWMDQPLEVNW